jgi:hypothetical protein
MESPQSKIIERLEELKVTRGEIVRMARRGQLSKVQCEMPTCYCHKGRSWFAPRSAPMTDWALNADHYPKLKQDGGTLTPGNIRLAHVLCNREDYQWRSRIRTKLDQGLSLSDIATELNERKVRAPHGTGRWTAQTVRKAYVS